MMEGIQGNFSNLKFASGKFLSFCQNVKIVWIGANREKF